MLYNYCRAFLGKKEDLMPGTGGEVLNKFLFVEAPPRGPTSYPLKYHFFTKKVPLSFTLLTNGTAPFHIPCLELYLHPF